MSLFDRLVVTTLPVVPKFIVRRVASRYVAGEQLEDALRVVDELHGEGAMATVDLLGEEVTRREAATEALDEYLRLADLIRERGLDHCNISVKPTQLGLAIDRDFCRQNFERLLEKASAQGTFVRLDMEDRTTTDDTIELYRGLLQRFCDGGIHTVGTVFQAYMRRTLRDIGKLPDEGANIRLCKGIYIEPRQAAWKDYETVRYNFIAALEKLFAQGVYVGIATHDEHLVCAAITLIDRLQIPRERYEFQMLLGVESELRKILLAEGHRLRVYIPYGRDWYLYSVRRLRENPKIAGYVLRALLLGQ
ncbi:MAG: proline dehydrogenase family protein [Acidobacteriota bacterium]